MSELRDTERLVGAYLQGLPVPEGPKVDEKVLPDALMAMQRTLGQRAAHTSRQTWRTIMTSHKTRWATAAAAMLLVVLAITVFDRMATPAWALEQAIEALRDFRAVYIEGAFPGTRAEIWMRSNEAGTQSTDVMIRWGHGAITWVKDGSTYHYEPGQDTVYSEPAITAGASPWLGPDLLDALGKAKGSRILEGRDAATGRARATLVSSIWDVQGPKSYVVEFDAQTNLPVWLKQWSNLDRSGPPAFEAFKITYYKDLSGDPFQPDLPGRPAYVEKPLTIPDENVGLLSDAEDGMAADGLTQQEACERILRANYQAVIDGDIRQLKRLAPLCKGIGDDLLRSLVLRTGKADQIAEIVEIGQILRTGQSKLGPIAAVPVVVRLKDGTKVEEKMIFQFRTVAGRSSCVVHGPYGLARGIE